MIEGRALIESIKKTKAAVESLGGKFKSSYSFKDIIDNSDDQNNMFSEKKDFIKCGFL